MGLLDIWDDYWDKPQHTGASTTFDDEWRKKKLRRGQIMSQPERSNLSTAGGVPTGNIIPRQHFKRGQSFGTGIPSHEDPDYVPKNRMGKKYPQASAQDIKEGKTIQLASGEHVVVPGASARVLASKNPNVAHVSKSGQVTYKQDASKTPNLAKNKVYQDAIMRGGKGANIPQDLNWWQKLSGMFNSKFDMDGAMASWKEKGGFEGLMANPAFTMGLAFMQAGAEGKTLGAGALDNVMKAAGISSHYKKIIEDRKLEPIQATGSDIAEVKDMLKSINIEEGNWFENFLGGQQSGAKWEAAVEEIAIEFQKEIREKQTALKEAGKSQVIKRTDQLKILERLVSSNKIKKKGSILSYLGLTSYTLQDTSGTKGFNNKAQGGPVARGQTYVVGEGGPEYFLPQESGKILSNDDSRIFSMLLSANPQLQNVSRTRSEKILRNRFPEYFE